MVPQAAVREVLPLWILLRRARVVSRLRCLLPRLRPRLSMAHSRCSGSATPQKYVHVRQPCLLCRCLTGVWQEPLVPDMAGSGVDILFKSTTKPDGTVHIDYKGEIKRYVCLYVCACVCVCGRGVHAVVSASCAAWLHRLNAAVFAELRALTNGLLAGSAEEWYVTTACAARWWQCANWTMLDANSGRSV